MTRHAKDNEQAILSAAARLFRSQGFAATTVREIAAAAGVLPGSLHYLFPSKELILIALMEKTVRKTTAAVREALAGSTHPIERLRLGLRAHLQALHSGDEAMHVLIFEWRTLTGEPKKNMIRLRDTYERFWDGLVDEAASSGYLRSEVDLKLLRLLSFGAVNWSTVWFSHRGSKRPEEIADAFWSFMGFGVFADKARAALPARPREPSPARTRPFAKKGVRKAVAASPATRALRGGPA